MKRRKKRLTISKRQKSEPKWVEQVLCEAAVQRRAGLNMFANRVIVEPAKPRKKRREKRKGWGGQMPFCSQNPPWMTGRFLWGASCADIASMGQPLPFIT